MMVDDDDDDDDDIYIMRCEMELNVSMYFV